MLCMCGWVCTCIYVSVHLCVYTHVLALLLAITASAHSAYPLPTHCLVSQLRANPPLKLLLEFESQTGVANAIMATHETNPCEELMKGCTHLSTPPEPGHPAGAAHTVSGCMSEGTHSHTTDVFH